MAIVKVNNPYFEKTYKVVEDKGDVEYALKNIARGNQTFLPNVAVKPLALAMGI